MATAAAKKQPRMVQNSSRKQKGNQAMDEIHQKHQKQQQQQQM